MSAGEWVVDRCGCGARIIQAVDERGDPMAVNAVPSTGGEYQLVARAEGPPLARWLTVKQRFGRQGRLYAPHSKRCAGAAAQRRRTA